jgi:hypothetical protein
MDSKGLSGIGLLRHGIAQLSLWISVLKEQRKVKQKLGALRSRQWTMIISEVLDILIGVV